MTITKDLSRNSLFDALGLKRMEESYLYENEQCPQDRFAYVSEAFSSNPAHAQRLYDYASKHWLSYSSPILSFHKERRGLPISCFLSYLEDTASGLVDTLSEVNWLSMLGGGVGLGVGIRASDKKSVGVLPHLRVYDASSLAYQQGQTRRGSYAAYLDIHHPDIIQFLEMRKPTGDPNMRCQNLHHGINVTDEFMEIIERCMLDPQADDSFVLRDEKNGAKETVSAKELWQRILEVRMQTGEPYLHFVDTSNRAMPQHLKDLGLKITQSNLCAEITLPTNKERTAVCCLSSVNLEYYDDWKDNEFFLRDVAEMLDNVLTYFIQNAPDEISRARFSAARERSIGVGALGFHAYLQKHRIAFDSMLGVSATHRIFKHIRGGLDEANSDLGLERGNCPDYTGEGFKRFSHLMAVAPNATSSIIMGNTSPSIEPYRANAYRQDTLSGSFFNRNKYLDKLIREKYPEEEYDDVWSSIISADGSCQHLDKLTEFERDTYKTAMEIDQRWIVEHAAARQGYIDQSQSVNLFFRPDASIKYLHMVHFLAWKKGLKSLYYCRSEKIGKADKISKRIEREAIKTDLTDIIDNNTCLACEG